MSISYSKSDIISLEGMEHIRLRPGMYCSSVGVDGVFHIFLEILSNSIDEYLAGSANHIIVEVGDDVYVVTDNGRGIPIGKHDDEMTVLQAVFGKVNTGGKFDSSGDSGYNSSGGLNGIGAKATNALSKFFNASTTRDGKNEIASFEKGKLVSSKCRTREWKTGEHGTSVQFSPDAEIFKETVTIPKERIIKQLQEFSFLCSGLRITFKYKEEEEIEFFTENGLEDYLKYLSVNNALITSPINYSSENFSFALAYNNSFTDSLKAYTNNIPNSSGTHLTGFRSALTRTVNNVARQQKLLTDKDDNFTGEDLKEGLVGVMSLKLKDPVFDGQTKNVLTSAEGRTIAEQATSEALKEIFNSDKMLLKTIVQKALRSRKARLAAKKAREVTRNKSTNLFKSVLPGKLSDCLKKTPKDTEIFLVEGDSAGGTAKQGRDRQLQAILPLRGKVLNAQRNDLVKLLGNEEIKNMITAFGCGIGKEFNIDNLRYEKIIIMTDADVDGEHIKILLLTFFFNYLPELIKQGYVYVALSPLYKVTKGKESIYLLTDEALNEYKKKYPKSKLTIQRFKGLGELSSEQLKETTMDKSNRRLLQIKIEDEKVVRDIVNTTMGNSVAPRKTFIENNSTIADIEV